MLLTQVPFAISVSMPLGPPHITHGQQLVLDFSLRAGRPATNLNHNRAPLVYECSGR